MQQHYVKMIAADVRNAVGNSAVNTPDKDAVKADLSWFNAGAEMAGHFTRVDDGKAQGLPILRDTVLSVLQSPPDSWESFKEGFKSVQVTREKANKPCDTIKVVRSQIARIFSAAKTQHSKVIQVLQDKEHFSNWKSVVKNMPKQGNAGVKSKTPSVSETDPGNVSIDEERNVGTLIQVIEKCISRLSEVSQPTHLHPLGAYLARELSGACQAAMQVYQETYAEFQVAQNPGNMLAFLKALELVVEGQEPEHLVQKPVGTVTAIDGEVVEVNETEEAAAELAAIDAEDNGFVNEELVAKAA